MTDDEQRDYGERLLRTWAAVPRDLEWRGNRISAMEPFDYTSIKEYKETAKVERIPVVEFRREPLEWRYDGKIIDGAWQVWGCIGRGPDMLVQGPTLREFRIRNGGGLGNAQEQLRADGQPDIQ